MRMFLDFSYYRKKYCTAVLLLNVGARIWLPFRRWCWFLFTLELLLVCELCTWAVSEKIYVGLEKPQLAPRRGSTRTGLMRKVLMRQVENCRDKAMYGDMMWKLSKLFVWRIVKMSSLFKIVQRDDESSN